MFGSARSLDDLANGGGVAAVFNAGSTTMGHHWQLFAQDGSELARTARVHNGGKVAQAFWKFVTVTGFDANNDIHVDVIGADGQALARASSSYMKEAVTVVDPADRQLARTSRDKEVFTVHGADDGTVAVVTCEGDGPWPVRNSAGDAIGELLADEPGPSLSPPLWQWVDPQWALNTATYNRAMHLGLRRVTRYAFAPTVRAETPVLALLPLLCGLTY